MQQFARKTLEMERLIAEHGPGKLTTPVLTHVLIHVRFLSFASLRASIRYVMKLAARGKCHL